MPMVIPLVAAAFEAYAGVTAVMAGVEGIAAVAAGLEIAGAALTVVGTITGNKNLTMIGGIAGGAGGGLGLVNGATDAATQAAAAASDQGGGSIAASLAAPSGDAASGAAGAATDASDFAAMDQGTGPIDTTGGDAATPPEPAGSSGGGLIDGANPNVAPAATADAPALAGAPPAAPTSPTIPGGNGTAGTPDGMGDYGSSTGPGSAGTSANTTPGGAPGGAATQPNQSWFNQVGDVLKSGANWSQQNPALTKVAGGLVQGAMSYYGSQQLANDNLTRAKNYQDWVRQRYSDSVRNLSIPAATVSAAPGSGIINGARPGP